VNPCDENHLLGTFGWVSLDKVPRDNPRSNWRMKLLLASES
jgi:hypothetical protein